MNYEEIKAAWNAQADEYNDWTTLSSDEIVEFAMSIEREECAKIVEKQTEQECIDPCCCVDELTFAASLIRNKA